LIWGFRKLRVVVSLFVLIVLNVCCVSSIFVVDMWLFFDFCGADCYCAVDVKLDLVQLVFLSL